MLGRASEWRSGLCGLDSRQGLQLDEFGTIPKFALFHRVNRRKKYWYGSEFVFDVNRRNCTNFGTVLNSSSV